MDTSGDGPGRRNRQPPTIDLKATEVAREAVSPEPEKPSAAAEQDTIAAASDQGAPAEAPVPEAGTPAEPPSPPEEPSDPAQDAPPPPPRKRGRAGALIAATLLGAGAGAAASAAVLWSAGLLPPREPVADPTGPRIAALDRRVSELASRPAPAVPPSTPAQPAAPAVDPKVVDDLAARLSAVERAVTNPAPAQADPGAGARAEETQTALKAVEEKIAGLANRIDQMDSAVRESRSRAEANSAAISELQNAARGSAADHTQIEALARRTAALEQATRAAAEELAKRAAAGSNDRAVRLAVAADALRNAVARGEPFTAELATIKSLGGDAVALAPLEPYASSGLPSNSVLGRELGQLVPAMREAAGTAQPREGSFLERLQANAEQLVRIRPLEEKTGDDAHAILSRIEIKAGSGDIPGALAELAKLPPEVRAPAQAWIAKAEARAKADAASRKLAADAFAALKPSP
jgi:hypothetical protein